MYFFCPGLSVKSNLLLPWRIIVYSHITTIKKVVIGLYIVNLYWWRRVHIISQWYIQNIEHKGRCLHLLVNSQHCKLLMSSNKHFRYTLPLFDKSSSLIFQAIQGVIPGFTPHYVEDDLHRDHQGALSSYECSHSFHSPTCHHPTRPKMHHGGVLGRVSTPHIVEVNENASKVKWKFYFSKQKSSIFNHCHYWVYHRNAFR